MSFLTHIYSGDGNYAPREPVALNRNSSLARSLIHALPLFGQDGLANLGSYGERAVATGTGILRLSEVSINAIVTDGSGADNNHVESQQLKSFSGDFTISTWVKADVLVDFQRIVSLRSSGGDHRFSLLTDDLALKHQVEGAGHGSSLGINLATGVPTHIGIRFTDSADLVEGFKDGILSTTTAAQTGTPGTQDFVAVFNAGTGLGNQGFNGKIWDVRVWHRALTDHEIYELWNPATRRNLYQPGARMIPFDTVVVGGAVPHGPLGHPLHGPFGGPV